MQKVRQRLLFLIHGYSEREIARQKGVSRPTIHLYSKLLKATGNNYDVLFNRGDHDLNTLVHSQKEQKDEPIDLRKFHFQQQAGYFLLELERVGVNRFLLWQEYLKLYPSEFQYSRFCELLDVEISSRKPSMRMVSK